MNAFARGWSVSLAAAVVAVTAAACASPPVVRYGDSTCPRAVPAEGTPCTAAIPFCGYRTEGDCEVRAHCAAEANAPFGEWVVVGGCRTRGPVATEALARPERVARRAAAAR